MDKVWGTIGALIMALVATEIFGAFGLGVTIVIALIFLGLTN
jgi:hypothetical protein